MARANLRFNICACGLRKSDKATVCRDCWEKGESRGRILDAPERATEHFVEDHAPRVSRSDLISYRRLLRVAAESIFDGFSIDYGARPQLASNIPPSIRLQYNQLTRAVARIDATLGSKKESTE